MLENVNMKMEMKFDMDDIMLDINKKVDPKYKQTMKVEDKNMWDFANKDTNAIQNKEFMGEISLNEKVEQIIDQNNLSPIIKKLKLRKKKSKISIEEKSKNTNIFDKKTSTFSELYLTNKLLKACGKLDYYRPTPIQREAIPHIMEGKDLLGSAETGSGKTAAYLLPILQQLLASSKSLSIMSTRVLIVVPTRELAVQTNSMLQRLKCLTNITSCQIMGGGNSKRESQELKQHPHILIATPGRLIDHLINTQGFTLGYVEVLVVDEADKLFDIGFEHELKEILGYLGEKRQTLMFSATLNTSVAKLGKIMLSKPVKLNLNSSTGKCRQYISRLRGSGDKGEPKTIGEPGAPKSMEEVEGIREVERERMSMCIYLLTSGLVPSRSIIFANTKLECHHLITILTFFGIKAVEVHGSQTQRERLLAVDAFQRGDALYLIGTDLVARGIDIHRVNSVVNYKFPIESKRYMHRIGRTARAGFTGSAFSICDNTERLSLNKLLRKYKEKAEPLKLPAQKVDQIKEVYAIISPYLRQIRKLEALEKEIRLATRDATKAENVILHAEQISRTPKKEWFMTQNEKTKIKKKDKEIKLEYKLRKIMKAKGRANKEKKRDIITMKMTKKEGRRGGKGRGETEGKKVVGKVAVGVFGEDRELDIDISKPKLDRVKKGQYVPKVDKKPIRKYKGKRVN